MGLDRLQLQLNKLLITFVTCVVQVVQVVCRSAQYVSKYIKDDVVLQLEYMVFRIVLLIGFFLNSLHSV